MRKTNEKVLAILCADMHLSHKPPIWRSVEDDWYEAMRRPLKEIEDLSRLHNCPVIMAGDIFHKWNSCPELINFALKYLPNARELISIPGQHDLPNHQIEDIQKSAYWTLSQANRLNEHNYDCHHHDKMMIKLFPFGSKLRPPTNDELCDRKKCLKIAVCHEYKWIKEYKFKNAPPESEFTATLKGDRVKGYDVIIYGDNHKGWSTKIGKTTIWNCGAMMRRHSDEINYKPRVGLLLSNGTIESYFLDISFDTHLTAEQIQDVIEDDFDMSDMLDILNKLGKSALDFSQAISTYMRLKGVCPKVRDIIIRNMEMK